MRFGLPGPPGPSSGTGLIHVIWEDRTPGRFDIFLKRYGAAFDPSTINLSNNLPGSHHPAFAVSGSSVYVVWDDDESGDGDILYKRSVDGGATFGETINLSNNVGESRSPAIAVSGNNVYSGLGRLYTRQ